MTREELSDDNWKISRAGLRAPRVAGLRSQLAGLFGYRPLGRMEVRLPLIAATLILFAAIGTAQVAIYWQSRDVARQTALLGRVYLDNLSANLAPKVAAGDLDGVSLAMERTLSYYEGIRDESLFLFDQTGKLIAQARRDGAPESSAIRALVFARREGTFEEPSGGRAWVWRPLASEGVVKGTIVAALNMEPLAEGRRYLSLYLLIAGLLVSAVAGVAGVWLIRRQLNPVTTVTRHLGEVAAGRLTEIPSVGNEAEATARLRSAFNQMVKAMREREAMTAKLAEQSRAAVLGRLAATIVHEVKNPLGGMKTAVETVKKYGDDRNVRGEAVGLIERGLETVEQVIDATLDSYKQPAKRRPFSGEDIADIATLIEAEARQRGIKFEKEVLLPERVALPAVETRQILLNLLLNACRATPRDGAVSLHGTLTGSDVTFDIADSGAGLEPEMVHALEYGEGGSADGLGIPIVRRLVDRLNGAIQVTRMEPQGTRLTVRLPLIPEDVVT